MVKNIPELENEIEKLKVKCAEYLDRCNKNAEIIEQLEAEIAELKTPDFYYGWDACEGGSGGKDLYNDVIDFAIIGDVCSLTKFKTLSNNFFVKTRGGGEEFDTQEEAEAFVESFKGEDK